MLTNCIQRFYKNYRWSMHCNALILTSVTAWHWYCVVRKSRMVTHILVFIFSKGAWLPLVACSLCFCPLERMVLPRTSPRRESKATEVKIIWNWAPVILNLDRLTQLGAECNLCKEKLYGDDGKMVEHYATEHNRLEEAIMDTKSVPVSSDITRAVLKQLFPDLLIFL